MPWSKSPKSCHTVVHMVPPWPGTRGIESTMLRTLDLLHPTIDALFYMAHPSGYDPTLAELLAFRHQCRPDMFPAPPAAPLPDSGTASTLFTQPWSPVPAFAELPAFAAELPTFAELEERRQACEEQLESITGVNAQLAEIHRVSEQRYHEQRQERRRLKGLRDLAKRKPAVPGPSGR